MALPRILSITTTRSVLIHIAWKDKSAFVCVCMYVYIVCDGQGKRQEDEIKNKETEGANEGKVVETKKYE